MVVRGRRAAVGLTPQGPALRGTGRRLSMSLNFRPLSLSLSGCNGINGAILFGSKNHVLTVAKCSQLKKEIQQTTLEVLMRQAAMAGNRDRKSMTTAPQTTASTF